MSRWVNGSLEDLLMVSISPRATSSRASALRAEQELTAWNGEEPPPTLPSLDADGPDRVFRVGAFLDELASDGLELGLRLLVVDSITTMLPADSEDEDTQVFLTHAASLVALREALDRVCTRAGDPRVSRAIGPDAPLGAYVKGLYLRASAVARALELFGFRALEPGGKRERDAQDKEDGRDQAAFARTLAEASAFHFPDLRDSIRRELATLRLELGQTSIVKGLRDAVEQLFVASAQVDGAGTNQPPPVFAPR